MKVRYLLLAQLIILAFLFVSPLSTAVFHPSFVGKVQAATLCPEVRGGSLSPSDVVTNEGALVESDKENAPCSGEGFVDKVICFFKGLFLSFSTSAGNKAELTLRNSRMPEYLRRANERALSGDPGSEEPGELTGSIARLLPPGYTQNEVDPRFGLTKAEGQLVSGFIVLNQRGPQKRFTAEVKESEESDNPGYYDLVETVTADEEEKEVENRQVVAEFGEVAPLYDRFGLLKQALLPFASGVGVPDPDRDCSISRYDPSPVAVTGIENANPDRDVVWQTVREITSDTEIGCTEDCPESDTKSFSVGGDLDVQTEVALASEAWERIGAPSSAPGEGGVFNILLPPGAYFRTEDTRDATIPYQYDTHTFAPDINTSSTLYIADLGNVGGATDCIYDQLTAHPANARYGVCEAALGYFAGIPIECTNEATPLPFENTSGSSVARRAWGIVNNLYQGFWCYWNWSKADYPNIFDEALYQTNPHPSRSEVENDSESLFWCTWLVWKTHSDHGPSLNSQNMKNYYESKGRFTSASEATYEDISPGDVVFFQTYAGPNRLNHVGIVYSVSKDAVVFIQSNAATKFDTLTVDDLDWKVQDLPWAEVGGFGRP